MTCSMCATKLENSPHIIWYGEVIPLCSQVCLERLIARLEELAGGPPDEPL